MPAMGGGALRTINKGGGSTMVARTFSRRQVLIGTGALAVVGTGLAPTAAFAAEADAPGKVKLLRWDLISVTGGVAIAGGTDVSLDSATGDTISVTGSGQAEPHEHEANGGGSFTHRSSLGTIRAHGTYVVTGFISFRNGGGSLVGVGPIDGIGELKETRGGVLTMSVSLRPVGGSPHDGVLTVYCGLPGVTFPIEEGITLSVLSFNFTQQHGITLFHVLQGGSSE